MLLKNLLVAMCHWSIFKNYISNMTIKHNIDTNMKIVCVEACYFTITVKHAKLNHWLDITFISSE